MKTRACDAVLTEGGVLAKKQQPQMNGPEKTER
jgi:hypothetical protein